MLKNGKKIKIYFKREQKNLLILKFCEKILSLKIWEA